MDENYLDRLLQEVEAGEPNLEEPEISFDSLDEEIPVDSVDLDSLTNSSFGAASEENPSDEKEKMEEQLFQDAERVPDVATADAEIPVEEISELDELDELADLDMDSLDFDDIDFDDIDVMNLNINPSQFEKELEDLDNLSIDEMYLDDSDDADFEEELKQAKEDDRSLEEMDAEIPEMVNTLDDEPVDSSDSLSAEDAETDPDEDDLNALLNELENMGDDSSDSSSDNEAPNEIPLDSFGTDSSDTAETEDSGLDALADLGAETSSDADSGEEGDFDLDSLMSEVFGDEMPPEVEAATEEAVNEPAVDAPATSDGGDDDMADLLSMLGMEPTEAATTSVPTGDELPDFDIPDELADLEDSSAKPKKKRNKFFEILFGPEEEEEEEALTPEQEAELERIKEEKKQAKLEKKKAAEEEKKKKKAQNAEKASKKKAENAEKAEAKRAKRAEEEAKELAEEGPVKPLNTTLVAIVIVFFLAVGGFVIVGTNIFDYQLVITKATNYFNREKYGLAYREIHGVDIKPKDEELAAQIYTVMYIERQYESYQNYVKMNRPEMALDALIQAEGKYDEHHQAAIDLGIEAQYNGVHDKILNILSTEFGISEQDAKDMLALEPTEYTEKVLSITDTVDFAPAEITEEKKEEKTEATTEETTEKESESLFDIFQSDEDDNSEASEASETSEE